MKVVILNNMAPFIWGGAEELAVHLGRNMRAMKIDAEIVRLPFKWEPSERLVDEMALARQLQLYNTDRVVALKFPAYLAPFDNKVLWLLHQYRQAYDLWDAGQSNIPHTEEGLAIREAIIAADNACFRQSRAIFTNHQTTSDRLKRYNGFDSQVLMPPLNDAEFFVGGEYQPFIAATGRVNATKRQHLLVEAMRHCPEALKLVIAGPPDTPEDERRLRDLVAKHGLEDRVELRLGFLPRAELADLVNRARAVAYLPFDEDSVGYVTMEAFEAGKPVITVDDSGGLLDLIVDGVTGFVTPPDPEALAQSLSRLGEDEALARRLGLAARAAWRDRGINWRTTIERLIA